MQRFYDGHSAWRWTDQFQNSNVVRIGAEGHIYGTNPDEPVPLRVQLVRSVLMRPILYDLAPFVIRAANVERDGKQLSCLLLSHSLPPNPAPRSWVEREDCIIPRPPCCKVGPKLRGSLRFTITPAPRIFMDTSCHVRSPYSKKGGSRFRCASRVSKTHPTSILRFSSQLQKWRTLETPFCDCRAACHCASILPCAHFQLLPARDHSRNSGCARRNRD